MKKLLFMLCLVFTTITVAAQDSTWGKKIFKEQFWTALYLGPNLSTLAGSEETNNKSLPGFHAGIGINVRNFSEVLGIRSELMYSQQGDQYSYNEGGNTWGGTYGYSSKTISRMNYLNLPIMAYYKSKSGFFAEAGLQPGLLLSAKEKRTSTGMGTGGGTTTTDIKKELNSFALGVPIGAGYVIKKKVGISARMTPGLLNVNKKNGAYTALKQKNFVLSARVSYFFGQSNKGNVKKTKN